MPTCFRLPRALCLVLLLCAWCCALQAQGKFCLTVETLFPEPQSWLLLDTDDIDECWDRYQQGGGFGRLVLRLRDSVQSLTPYERHVIKTMENLHRVDIPSGGECIYGWLGLGASHTPPADRFFVPCPLLQSVDFGIGRAPTSVGGECMPSDSFSRFFFKMDMTGPASDNTLLGCLAALVSAYLMHDVRGEALPLQMQWADGLVPNAQAILPGRLFQQEVMMRTAHDRALRQSTQLILEALTEASARRAPTVAPPGAIVPALSPAPLAGAYGIAGAEAAGGPAPVRVFSAAGDFLVELSRAEFDALGLRLEQHGPASSGRKRKHD